MSNLKKKIDKKVNFEFNKEYIKVIEEKIQKNDVNFITNSFREMHPADAADIIEHLSQDDRENLIKLNNFKLDPELFVELNENIQSEIIKLLSTASIIFILKNLESDDAIKILENIEEKSKNEILISVIGGILKVSRIKSKQGKLYIKEMDTEVFKVGDIFT